MKLELQVGKIYIIKCISPLPDNFVKIGFAIDPKLRLVELQRGCPYQLILLREFRGYIWQEKWIQNYFKSSLIHGEWFNFKDEMLKILANKRQELMNDYIKQSNKPIIFGGHHDEGGHILDIPTINRWLLNTDPKTSAKRAYERSLKEELKSRRLESELPQDTQEAQEYIDFLKSNNYQPLSAEEISQKVGNYV